GSALLLKFFDKGKFLLGFLVENQFGSGRQQLFKDFALAFVVSGKNKDLIFPADRSEQFGHAVPIFIIKNKLANIIAIYGHVNGSLQYCRGFAAIGKSSRPDPYLVAIDSCRDSFP